MGLIRPISLLWLILLLPVTSHPSPVTLRFTSWDGDEALKVLRKSIARFEQRYPNIKVQLENIDNGVYQQKILTQYAANVAPDVGMMDPNNFLRLAKRNAILPLNQFFADTPGFKLDDYYKPIVDAQSWQGRLYVLPRDIAPIGIIYYNKKLFDEAHIPYPDGSWTWDFQPRPWLREKDFLWVMQQLTLGARTSPSAPGNADGDVRAPKQYGFSPGWSYLLGQSFAFCLGAEYTDNDQDPTQLRTDSPVWQQGMQLAADLMFKYKWVPSTADYQGAMQTNATLLFVAGKLAMYQTGIWEVPNLRKYLQPGKPGWFDYDIAMFPAYKDGRRRFPTGGSGYCIFSSTKHPHGAWLLTQWMGGPEGMKDLAESGLAQPAIKRIALEDPWIPGPHTPPDMQYPHSRIVTDQAVQYVKFDPNGDLYPEVKGLVGAKTDLIWIGSASVKDALTQGTRDGQARLDQLRKQQHLPNLNWTWALGVGALILAALFAWIFWPNNQQPTTNNPKDSRAAYRFLAPWLLGTFALTLGPMILSLIMSFSDWDIILPARWRGTANYTEAFTQDQRFWQALKVTGIYTALAVPIGLVLAMCLALLLNQKVRGIPIFRACFYVPSLASLVAASLIWRRIFQPEGGLLNSLIDLIASPVTGHPSPPINWLGDEHTALISLIIMSFWGVGGAMIILLAGLQGIPQQYYEAAVVDGAGNLSRFRNVTLPLLTPTIFFSLVTGIIGSFQVFTQSFVMTNGGPNDATLFYMLHLYNQAFNSLRMGYASALAWVLFAIILIFTLLQFRFSRWVYYEAETK